jgi:hypothetical protein
MQVPSHVGLINAAVNLSTEEMEGQLARVLNSQSFRNSTVLQSFLRYVTEQTICGRSSEVNEYTIATTAMGRGPDFDSASDTIVRTQAYRLRQKLHEYYSTEGTKDRLVIEIPKGHYIPTFRSRLATECLEPILTTPSPQAHQQAAPSRRFVLPMRGILALVFVCAFALGLLFDRRLSVRNREGAAPPSSTAVDSFWQSLLQTDKEPIVAYTNMLLLETDRGDLFSFPGGAVGERGTVAGPEIINSLTKKLDAPVRGPLYFEDSMTGVGDVLAAVAVSTAMVHAGGHPSFKRGRLLTTYDLENHSVVFIGSSFVNDIINDLPDQPKFIFTRKPLLWASGIEDLGAAAKGSSSRYTTERSPDSRMIVADYAVISCLRSLKPGLRILILAGLTTSGTAAAAEFATSPDGIAEMSRRLSRPQASKPAWPGYFEYLLRTQVSHGIDVVRSECVASHSNP